MKREFDEFLLMTGKDKSVSPTVFVQEILLPLHEPCELPLVAYAPHHDPKHTSPFGPSHHGEPHTKLHPVLRLSQHPISTPSRGMVPPGGVLQLRLTVK